MIKKLLFLLFALVLYACEEKADTSQPIKIGTENTSLVHLTLYPQSRHDILLSGGNHKYTVNVANSRLVGASISQDTLKIQSFQEQGSTFMIIRSHDQAARLNITVQPNELNFTAKEVTLAPTDINKTIQLGGGDIVSITTADPDDIMKTTWDGNSGILEIRGKAEGDATIIASSAGLTSKELKVKVRCIDDKHFLDNLGVNKNTSRYITQAINPTVIQKSQTTGTLFSGQNNINATNNSCYRIPPIINPVQGTYMDLRIEYKKIRGSVTYETLKFYVEEVRTITRQVVLRGRTLKIVVPYY